MGQKVHPKGLRVGIIRDWDSKWYASKKDFSKFLIEDQKLRKEIKTKLYAARISTIVIERNHNNVNIIINAAKPGMVIGKNGAQLEELKKELSKIVDGDVSISVVDIKKPDVDAQVVAENIASQLERRVSFRRAMKQAMQRTMRAGAKGIKVAVSGRLGGADMARTEFYKEGTIPLQTIRADIDYGFAEANTTFYGKQGVKVWIYKGDVLEGRIETGSVASEGKTDSKNNRKRNNKNNKGRNNRRNTPERNDKKEVEDGNNTEEN